MSDYIEDIESKMSDYIEDIESKLSVVIRKPQEGKTFICITYITSDKTNSIHIVFTMNTLKAGMQFFGRMEELVGSKNIIIFNSNKNTAGKCHHAKSVSDVLLLLAKNPNIKVIVCCAHGERFRTSIPELFLLIGDSITLKNRKFKVDIDEAHKYIPENLEHIRIINTCPVVESIVGYSGSPYKMWTKKPDSLFYKILIRDVEAELNIIRSLDYFGVNNCEFYILEEEISQNEIISLAEIEETVPIVVCSRAGFNEHKTFYGNDYYFNLGNEILLLSFIDYTLKNKIIIDPLQFSYHFVPAYNRKVTHYAVVEIILKYTPTANVIVMNGNGMELFRIKNNKSIRINTSTQIEAMASKEEKQKLLEPSYMIQQLIKEKSDCPTFVTGFICVGMSVTLINEELGNFDSVIMDHHHYKDIDIPYQLCRFLFNYTNWSPESKSKIKTTKFYSLTKSVVDTCIGYERNVERISTEFVGKVCSLREIQGLEPEEPTVREIKTIELNNINIINPKIWKKFKVYDGNDEEMWSKASNFYREIKGKELKGKSMPTDIDGFWNCTTTSAGRDKHTTVDITKLEKHSWPSTFQLKKHQLTYARVFVGYERLDDPTEYTISIKYVQLEDSKLTHDFLIKYYSK